MPLGWLMHAEETDAYVPKTRGQNFFVPYFSYLLQVLDFKDFSRARFRTFKYLISAILGEPFFLFPFIREHSREKRGHKSERRSKNIGEILERNQDQVHIHFKNSNKRFYLLIIFYPLFSLTCNVFL